MPAHPGEYDGAAALGTVPVELLVETFGGLGPALANLLVEAAEVRRNKLTRGEYDEASWATRTWKALAVHRLSVAVQRSVAWEIAKALDLGARCDSRAAVVV